MAQSQSPMLSSPLKQTQEVDWVTPLKSYIRSTYGDDPERYAEECATLNRLRQDMRGAGKDSAAGRDLLYRYYGQLELLDLRFPVDEKNIKISFTWFDAFTHKPTAQYSLAYEKASIIFNISAVLSCHASHQNRSEDGGVKTAYHSFQASAGMFTYINDNFLHAPSTDLSRDTVKCLIWIMLAQGQEVFLEKQINDGKKVGMLAKLASQAAGLYAQALEGVIDNVAKGVFEKVWQLVVQIKSNYMASLAQYFQALADNDANNHGVAISRLHVADNQGREANRLASAFPTTVPSASNLSSETGAILVEMTKRNLANITERIVEFTKDNDFIYHQTVPAEASLAAVPKLAAAKAIPVSELYQGQDIQRIIGPDIFQRIVPISVTETASLYDEEKAKLIRAETERVEVADDELVASLDYLKLPGSLEILKGGQGDGEMTLDPDFRNWCSELAGHQPFSTTFDAQNTEKVAIGAALDSSLKSLDTEEAVCEKMRNKYGDDWTQQPSSRLTATLRADIRNYRNTVEEAGNSDAQLYATFRQYEADFEEMRSAGETDEADVLYQRALIKAGAQKKGVKSPTSEQGDLLGEEFDDGPSVREQIERVEELMRKLQLVKRERVQVLKDLKEKVHTDDIQNVLILNKKSISNQEAALFKQELEKFRPHQNRILATVHKQSSLLKELTRTYGDLLQDKRVRAEQSKYESFSRQRSTVLTKYRKVFQAFNDLEAGLMRAQTFYSEMKETVESLLKNVETFVSNRRSEGGQLLQSIEERKRAGNGDHAEFERRRLEELMERMSVNPTEKERGSPIKRTGSARPSTHSQSSYQQSYQSPPYNPATSPPVSTYGVQQQQQQQQQQQTAYHRRPSYSSNGSGYPASQQTYASPASSQAFATQSGQYNPTTYQQMSPPPGQAHFYQPPPGQQRGTPQPTTAQQYQQRTSISQMPPGWQPPPPPPGPPPNQGGDPYAGLGGWR